MNYFRVNRSVAIEYIHSAAQLPPLSGCKRLPSPQSKTPYPLAVTLHFLSPSPWQPPVRFLFLWICQLWTVRVNGIIQYVAFSNRLLSFSLMLSRFIHAVACLRTSLLFTAKECPPHGYSTFHPSAHLPVDI